MTKKILGPYILGSALIWGLTLIAASLMLGGFEDKAPVVSLLSAAAGVHLIIIWVPLAAALKKLMSQQDEEQRE